MSLVVDANAANALAQGGCRSSARILQWARTKGQVISGGLLQRELSQTKLRPLLVAWGAAGRLKVIAQGELDPEIARIAPIAASNDAHVLAVVSVGNAGVVVTGDELLKQDLKQPGVTGRKRKIISCKDGAFSPDNIVQSLLRLYG